MKRRKESQSVWRWWYETSLIHFVLFLSVIFGLLTFAAPPKSWIFGVVSRDRFFFAYMEKRVYFHLKLILSRVLVLFGILFFLVCAVAGISQTHLSVVETCDGWEASTKLRARRQWPEFNRYDHRRHQYLSIYIYPYQWTHWKLPHRNLSCLDMCLMTHNKLSKITWWEAKGDEKCEQEFHKLVRAAAVA